MNISQNPGFNFFTFRSTIRSHHNELKKFLLYCVYAFGTPIVLTVVLSALDATRAFPDHLLLLIGTQRCWIQNSRITSAVFVYTPIAIVVVVNIYFYVSTAWKIQKVQRETSVIREGENCTHSRTNTNKTR